MPNENKHPFENLPQKPLNTRETIYTQQYEAWLQTQKAKGLQYVNIYYGDGLHQNNVNYESFCEEFMRMVNAPTVPDPEVLGKRSF